MPYERKTSDIFISDDLRNILTEIESQSMVASLLLKKRHSNEDLIEDFVNHISVSREDKGKISYLTKERFAAIDESEIWTSSRRFQAKPGGFISKVFKDIPAKEVELFSTLFRNVSNRIKVDLQVVKGERIRDFYYYESYASDNGSLGASCMRYDNCQKYMNVYVENTDVVSMLVMLNDNGSLIGRALLWDCDGYKIMDRIYTTNDEKYAFYFKEWATKNNYLFKSNQNWFDTLTFEKIGDKKQELRIDIKLPNSDYRYYPYMDTFKFFNAETGTISNYQPKSDFYTICTPDGSKYGSDYLVFDIIDKVFRYRHDACYVRYLDGFTTGNNVSYSEIHDEYILCSDATYDDELSDYIFNEEKSSNNDSERIKRRREEIKRRNEERARRDAERTKRREEEALELEKARAERGEHEEQPTTRARDLLDILSQYSDSDLNFGNTSILDMLRTYDDYSRTYERPVTSRSRRQPVEELAEEEPAQAPVVSSDPTPIDTSRFNIVYDMPPLDYYEQESQEESFDDLPF
jgi:hypothetical protein